MPTLEELFRNKKYERLGDRTPEEAFAVRNSKDIQISTISPFLNKTSVPLINKDRAGKAADRFSETRRESELIGLLPFTNYSEPVLYGTDIIRITAQQTSLGEAMKAGTGGRGLVATAARVAGDIVGEGVQFGGSKLLKVPSTFNAKSAAIKAGASIKNTLGSLFPDILIPSKIVASPVFTAKVPGFNEEYRVHETLANLKSISAGTKVASFLAKNATGTPDQIKQAVVGQGLNVVKNERQFGKPPLNFANQEYTITDTSIDDRIDLSTKYLIEFDGVPNSDLIKSGKARFLKEKNQAESNYLDGDTNGIWKYSKIPRKTDRTTLEINTTSDRKNWSSPYEGEQADIISENDYVPLKFTSVATGTSVMFRGTITGLSEQLSPSWDSSRFIGAPFNFYTYQSIERTLQFSFKVFSLNGLEHKACWARLGYLSSLCYPQSYNGASGAVTAPFLKFTLGDMYRAKECFIENMSYNIDDNYPWEVGLNGKDLQNYRLPTIVEVTITLKFVEAKSNTYNEITDSDGKLDNTELGSKMYGFKETYNNAESRQNDKQFTSTNKADVPIEPNKPSSETNQAETGNPYPQDETNEALLIRDKFKLRETNIFHTALGQTKSRRVYRQKKTGKLYFGDGTPYDGFGKEKAGPDLSFVTKVDIVDNPLTTNTIAS